MPAHFAAAQAAYPWLACRELEREVPGYFGGRVPTLHGVMDWNRSACLGKESTFQFIFDVIDEVCDKYGKKYESFGGWYISGEISRKTKGAIDAFHTMGKQCKDVSGGLPTFISPWIDGKIAVKGTGKLT